MTDFSGFRSIICGIDELEGHAAAGVTHVLSILDPGWPEPAAFGAFGAHRRLDLRFHDIIEELPDQRAVARQDIAALLGFGRALAAAPGAHLLVHCQAGISRSTAALALILIQAWPERPAAAAVAEIARLRPRAWPNLRMIELGDEFLGLDGGLVAAVVAHYRRRLERRPELALVAAGLGRQREVDRARAAD
ncbi:MAG TPA: protein-tyrosine-phosphatase [Stellaceae bacterium]|nr:protein-tyrosine-phosphatase [Stellaceae bacterium]